jgi:preprotein translocase subunit SecE
MAVAEAAKVEKDDKPTTPEGGGALAEALGWLPRKVREGRAFLTEVRAELRKVTWPSRKEVYSTTLVVIATSIFFGFYLWGLDLVFSRVLAVVLRK